MQGPKAPKDPVKKRPGLFILVDTVIEGSPRANGKYQDICYLNGRIVQKITVLCDKVDKEILNLIQTCAGFRKLVHSIGISITATKAENQKDEAEFALHSLSKEASGEGTCYTKKVTCDGREEKLFLSDYPTEEKDDILGSFTTTFPEHETAKMTVCFYLNDGYSVPEITPDPPIDFHSEAYRKLVERSLLHMGNTYRFQQAAEKARRGEEVTVAYLGGSITQGAGAKPIHTDSYAYLSYTAFRKRYGKGNGDNVKLIKAGAGGTCSELGLTRYEKDILREGTRKPDILFLEYAVNDAGDETNGECFESLVRMALDGPGKPAVILLFAVFMDDFTLQERLQPIGMRYELPMISMKNAVTAQFYEEHPVLTKRQYFYDLFHPSNNGHRIMADCIENYFAKAEGITAERDTVIAEGAPVIGDNFRRLIFFDRKNFQVRNEVHDLKMGAFSSVDTDLQCVEKDDKMKAEPEFPDNFMKPAGSKNEPFCVSLFCKDILLTYKDSGDHQFGTAEVLVDGVVTRTIDPLEVSWTHCTAYIVFRSDTAAEHTVTVRMKEGFEEKAFTILGVSYTL